MAEQGGSILTLTAGAAVVRRRFVKLTAGKVIQSAASTDEVVGVASDDAAADGSPLGVIMACGACTVEVEAGETIAAGDKISSDGTGRAATSTSGDPVVGYALSEGTVGQFVEVLLQKQEAVA